MERVYLYKITFEEVPHWYWGIHWEKDPLDGYMGSPITNKWFWSWYTPERTICQIFDPTKEGWEQALRIERKVIRPDLHNPLCLNERCGSALSICAIKRGVKASHSRRNEEGKSIRILEHNRKLHEAKDERGKSLHALAMKEKAQAEKDVDGKSLHAKKMSAAVHAKKTEEGKSEHAIKAGKAGKGLLHWNNGIKNTKARECPGEGWKRGYLRKLH